MYLSRRSCQREDGSEDPKKGTQLLDIYALEIQMATEQRNTKQLKRLYQQARGPPDSHLRTLTSLAEPPSRPLRLTCQTWSASVTVHVDLQRPES